MLSLALAPACGKSSRNGADSTPTDGGADVGGEGADAGERSDAGNSSSGGRGGSGTGGKQQAGGEPGSAGAAEGGNGAWVGNGGDGGDGGDGGTPGPSPICDDGNACTFDVFDAGACRHDPAPDGQLCEDGNFCTMGDHCSAGACVPGALQHSAGHALGSLDSYGVGLSLTPGGDRFAFVDVPTYQYPARLTVADVDAGVLKRRDQIDIDVGVGGSFIGAAWDDLVVVADGDTSFGLNGPSRNLQLFSVEADGSLTAHPIAPITPGAPENPANASMVGRGSQLLLCHNWSFFSAPQGTLMWWDVSDPDAPVLIAQGKTNGQCGSLAVSEDGQRVYVNTVNGVIWSDLSTWTSGDITFAVDKLVTVDAGLSLRGDRLVARSGEQVRVFDESDHGLVTSFTVAGANGAVLTDAGIVVSQDQAVGSGTENYLSLYSLTGALLQKVLVQKLSFKRDLTSQRLTANQGYVIDPLSRRLFSVAPDGLGDVEEPEVGALHWAFAGIDAVHVRSPFTAQRVDISDPAAPVFVAGGPTRDATFGIKLDESLTPAALLADVEPRPGAFDPDPWLVGVYPSLGHAAQTSIESVSVDADEHYVAGASLSLPGGEATLRVAGDFAYRAAVVPGGGGVQVHLQRWQLQDLRAHIAAPSTDLVFDAPASAPVTARFDVDPVARVAVLTTTWAEAQVATGKLYWIDFTAEPAKVVETTPLSVAAFDVRVRGDAVVYAEPATPGTRLHFRRRQNDSEASFSAAERMPRLLAFDGTTVYYASERSLAAVTTASQAPSLSLTIPLRSTPTSLAFLPQALVVTSDQQLLTFTPACQ